MSDDSDFIGLNHPIADILPEALAYQFVNKLGEHRAREALLAMCDDPDTTIDPELLYKALSLLDAPPGQCFQGSETEPDEDGETIRVGGYFLGDGPRTFVVEWYDEGIEDRLFEHLGEPPLGTHDLPLPIEAWEHAKVSVEHLLPKFLRAERLVDDTAGPLSALMNVGYNAGGAPGLLATMALAWCDQLSSEDPSEDDEWRTVETALRIAMPWMPMITDPWIDESAIRSIAADGVCKPDQLKLEAMRST